MTADLKKKPSAGFWITVALVAVLVAYPLSFGPACWLYFHTQSHEMYRAVVSVYRPILWFGRRTPRGIQNLISQYMRLGIPSDWDAGFEQDYIGFWHPD